MQRDVVTAIAIKQILDVTLYIRLGIKTIQRPYISYRYYTMTEI